MARKEGEWYQIGLSKEKLPFLFFLLGTYSDMMGPTSEGTFLVT